MLTFVLVVAALASAPAQSIPDDKAQQAADIVATAARDFYQRWGKTLADDNVVMREMLEVGLAQRVVDERARCANAAGACADTMTCLAERAEVTSVRLLPTSTTALLKARVELTGAKTGTKTATQWHVRMGDQTARVSEVVCASAAPLPVARAALAPEATVPTTIAPPPGHASVTQLMAAASFIQTYAAVRGDAARTRAFLQSMGAAGQRHFEQCQKNPALPLCAHPIVCGSENTFNLEVEGAGAAVDVAIEFPSRKTVKTRLIFEGGTTVVSDWQCLGEPVDGVVIAPEPEPIGRCEGDAAPCAEVCAQQGCRLSFNTGLCTGTPQPCSVREKKSCTRACHWVGDSSP